MALKFILVEIVLVETVLVEDPLYLQFHEIHNFETDQLIIGLDIIHGTFIKG